MSVTKESAIRFRSKINTEKEVYGLTDSDLAKLCDVSPDTYRKHLNDPTKMSVGQLLSVADFLHIDRGELIGSLKKER